MQTETVQHAFVNRELSDNLFVPRAFKRVQQLRLDEVYPYNPDIVNLNSKIRDYMSNHYHENVSYLDTLGHPKTREYFAQIYKVNPEDVCIAPTISLARWYLTTLFLDDEDSISCNAGLSPE